MLISISRTYRVFTWARIIIALLFEVDVVAVRTLVVRGKKKRTGCRSDWKKAYVRIGDGQDIKFAEEV